MNHGGPFRARGAYVIAHRHTHMPEEQRLDIIWATVFIMIITL